MKPLFITGNLLLLVGFCQAQPLKIEPVDWLTPNVYKTKAFSFKADSVEFYASNCKILELRIESGVTGYYVEGNGVVNIMTKGLSEKCSSAMFRFNPAELDSLVSTNKLVILDDDEFVSASLDVLKNSFRHCYHSGMDAIIPNLGSYAVDFFSQKLGEILVSRHGGEYFYYNFTLGSKL